MPSVLGAHFNQISFMVLKGIDTVEISKQDLLGMCKAKYQMALQRAFARYPDTGLELVFDRKKRAAYVRTIKDVAEGALIIVPAGPLVKSRFTSYGEQLGHLDSFMCDAPDGSRIVCSPMTKTLCDATVSTTFVWGACRV